MADPVTNPPASTPLQPSPNASAESAELIERIRQEEKAKLYGELQDLRSRLDAAINETSSKEKEYKGQLEELNRQLSLLQKAASGNLDPIALAREVADDTRKILVQEHSKEVRELQARLERLEQEREQARLESIRQKLISDANGRIIPAMVRGNNEAELKASAEAAMQEYERIVKAHSTPTPAAPAAVVPSAGPGTGTGEGIPIVQTGRTDPKVYSANRQKVLAEIRARHG